MGSESFVVVVVVVDQDEQCWLGWEDTGFQMSGERPGGKGAPKKDRWSQACFVATWMTISEKGPAA